MAGMSPTVSIRGGRRSLDAAINLVPFIDLLSCCISFLLITAVWTQMAAVDLPRDGRCIDCGDSPMPHRVLLRIEPNGYVLTGRAGPQKIVHGTGDDETRLAAALAGARAIEPRPVQLSVAVGDGTAYGRVIRAIDLARAARFTDVRLGDED